MLSRLLALRLFEAFSIQRWNDRIRPVEITEMDKQGFKAVLTYFFAKLEEQKGVNVDWEYLVYGSLFALMKNIVLSDIKAPVIKKIKEEHATEYKALNYWVVNEYRYIINDEELLTMFADFLNSDDEKNINLRIIRAAHKYSTLFEFEIIKKFNSNYPKIYDLERDVTSGIESYSDLEGVKQIFTAKQDFYEAIYMIDQLRYQIRWSQTPRIPKTTVLGHSMYVACLMIFFSRHMKACNQRLTNNFFAGLFHDLPEAVVRDIISPVKRATQNLPDIVKDIESEICELELYPKLPEYVSKDIRYLIGDNLEDGNEFSNRILKGDKSVVLKDNESISEFNQDRYSPVDGKIIKVADEIAAFIEAEQSISHGITSRHLQDGMANIRTKYIKENLDINGLDLKGFFSEFY